LNDANQGKRRRCIAMVVGLGSLLLGGCERRYGWQERCLEGGGIVIVSAYYGPGLTERLPRGCYSRPVPLSITPSTEARP
jgi:hypothetical protein